LPPTVDLGRIHLGEPQGHGIAFARDLLDGICAPVIAEGENVIAAAAVHGIVASAASDFSITLKNYSLSGFSD